MTHLLPGAEYACALTVVNMAGESEPSEAVYLAITPTLTLTLTPTPTLKK